MKFIRSIYLIPGLISIFASCSIFNNSNNNTEPPSELKKPAEPFSKLKNWANEVKIFVQGKGFSEDYCFLIDMSIPSGKKRFFVYNTKTNSVLFSGLVAHGCCNESFLKEAKFSNTPNCGCSSLGKYKVGNAYSGQYGKSYKLYGMESTNSNALKRGVVLHGFSCVPDEEIYPRDVCNSLGCTMVSPAFFNKVSRIIDQSKKSIVLWIYK